MNLQFSSSETSLTIKLRNDYFPKSNEGVTALVNAYSAYCKAADHSSRGPITVEEFLIKVFDFTFHDGESDYHCHISVLGEGADFIITEKGKEIYRYTVE